ncbi:hypothetical protein C8Q75DRAFT_810496 [Abortiporus biennis]|nr:hypothetical protein C8Q75DRAFT_810496 [Abortiporus biennis]
MARLTGLLAYKPQFDAASLGFMKLHGMNLQEKHAWFDEQIMTSLDTYLALTRLRNSRVPIGLLSDEILLRIFIFACSSLRDCARTSTSVSQVCYHWRTLALQTPQLWTTLDIAAYPNFAVDVQLPRAKDLPINLIYQRRHRHTNALKKSANEVFRFDFSMIDILQKLPTCVQVVALYLNTKDVDSIGHLRKEFKLCFPGDTSYITWHMRILKIVWTRDGTETQDQKNNILDSISGFGNYLTDLFAMRSENSKQNLDEICLHGIILLPATFSLYCSLKTLVLTDDRGALPTTYGHFSMDYLCRILQQCTGLEVLTVRHAHPRLPVDAVEYPTGMFKAELTCLKFLTVEYENFLDTAHLVFRLIIPSTATVECSPPLPH